MDKIIKDNILSIPVWDQNIEITKIDGGLTNQNFLVTDNINKYFVDMKSL